MANASDAVKCSDATAPKGAVESGRDGAESGSHRPWQQFFNPINRMVSDVREDVA